MTSLLFLFPTSRKDAVMKIPLYLTSLLPTFGKERIIEDCNVVRGEITEFTHPAYAIAAPDFKSYKFKSDRMKGINASLERQLKKSPHDNIVTAIEKGFKPMLANLDEVKKLVEATYGDDVGGAGITYLKANLLQFVELIGFVSKYARKLLIYIYAAETETYPDSGTVFTDSIVPAEIEWINANVVNFATAFNIVTIASADVKKSLSEVPDIVVKQESADAMNQTLGERKLDPFSMKLIPVWLNPIFHVRMFVAEWQTTRYHEAKAELQLLQLHKLHLEKLREGKPDAKLKQEIDYTENRINKLSYKLKEMEGGND
jgi:hypothetical protein